MTDQISHDPNPNAKPNGNTNTGASADASGRVADATERNWVDRFAPSVTRPYLRLSRADRPAGTWLLLLPCLWGLGLAAMADGQGFTAYDLWIALGCTLGAFLMRGAGCTWNDLADQDIDAAVTRTRSRPLPSGQVTRAQAKIWMVVQSFLALVILLTFPPVAIALGLASLGLVAIYPYAKRFTWWPQIFLGLAFNWGVLVAWAAHFNALHLAPFAVYLAGICWTLFYDTIYAHQDREDDALIGVKSTARLFDRDTGRWLLAFLVASTLLMSWAVINVTLDQSPIALLIGLGTVWAFGWHLNWQMRKLDIDDPMVCWGLFRSNRDAGLILALGFALAAMGSTLS
ncbi:MAG: 4-hydroxybenzoate octaprenyltransferase [Pseudomonadota bacterium]